MNEALFLQQLHYWLERSTKIINNRRWIYNSVGAWQKQFSFWSISTLKRIIASLEKRKLIITDNFNSFSMDRTKWYTIDYDELDKLEDEKIFHLMTIIIQIIQAITIIRAKTAKNQVILPMVQVALMAKIKNLKQIV